MNKIQKNLLIYLIIIFFIFEFIINSQDKINIFFRTINLCVNNLLPNIFIFFTISDLLNNYNFPYYLSKIFGNIIQKIYKIPKVSSYIIFLSLTTGFPGNAKLIKEQLDNKTIDEYDATKIIAMTHFSNPLFIIYSIGNNIFHDATIGFIILVVHYLTNFIIGFFFRNIYPFENKKDNLLPNKPLSFITLLKNSFYNTTKILISIFGIIIFFNLISTTLSNYLKLSPFSNVIFNGLIEITTGLKLLTLLKIEKAAAAALITFFISFGGFAIHLQIKTILSKYKINYYVYLIARIFHAIISSIIVYLILANYK